jgi:hypothetical protein
MFPSLGIFPRFLNNISASPQSTLNCQPASKMASPDVSADPAPEVGRLQATFQAHPFSAHGAQWDQLWKESYSPWDRGGPSLALNDLLEQHPRLFPSIAGRKPRALVPGCGRGHDVLLLSAFGYDVTGLDVSETSLKEAAENERLNSGEDIYAVREGIAAEKGKVTWMTADFFDSENASLKPGSFDLIYDYTVSITLAYSMCVLVGSTFIVLLRSPTRGPTKVGKEDVRTAQSRRRKTGLPRVASQ